MFCDWQPVVSSLTRKHLRVSISGYRASAQELRRLAESLELQRLACLGCALLALSNAEGFRAGSPCRL